MAKPVRIPSPFYRAALPHTTRRSDHDVGDPVNGARPRQQWTPVDAPPALEAICASVTIDGFPPLVPTALPRPDCMLRHA